MIELIFKPDPITDFVIVMFMIMLLPNLMEKIKLPGILGLLLGGLFLGPAMLGVLTPGEGVISFLADVGKLMVMFFAGLEIDFDKFISNWRKSLIFGGFTFLLPLFAGFALSFIFGMSIITSFLIGSLLASHTLIALPLLIKYKAFSKESVSVTVGATIFTDIASLIILSICISLHTTGFSWSNLAMRGLGIVIYMPIVLFGAKWIARKYFSWIEKDENNKTAMMLFIMMLAAIGAEVIHLEGIIGAFIVGLAVNEVIKDGRVKNKLDTLGNILFIPMFFLILGAMIDPASFVQMNGDDYFFALLLIVFLIMSKFLAAKISAYILGYKKGDGLLMWSLSIPQVAATLAASLVAFQTYNKDGEPLISKMVFDSILILMAVTVVAGPILTEVYLKSGMVSEK